MSGAAVEVAQHPQHEEEQHRDESSSDDKGGGEANNVHPEKASSR